MGKKWVAAAAKLPVAATITAAADTVATNNLSAAAANANFSTSAATSTLPAATDGLVKRNELCEVCGIGDCMLVCSTYNLVFHHRCVPTTINAMNCGAAGSAS